MKYKSDLNALVEEIFNLINMEYNPQILENTHEMIYEDAIDYLIKLVNELKNKEIITQDDYTNIINVFIKNRIFENEKKFNFRVEWLKKMGLLNSDIQLKKSHIEILNTFDRINILLNSINADYYHTSGLLTYLLTNNELERYHHDLDIFISEKNLDELKKSCSETEFEFREYLGQKDDNCKRRTIKIYDNQNNITISIFIFERLHDNSIIVNDYYFDSEGNLKMDQDYNSPESAKLSFSDELKNHNGIPYYSITLEALYNCKKGRNYKHQYDCSIIEKEVDFYLESKIDAAREPLRHFDFVENKKISNDMRRMLENENRSIKQKKFAKK